MFVLAPTKKSVPPTFVDPLALRRCLAFNSPHHAFATQCPQLCTPPQSNRMTRLLVSADGDSFSRIPNRFAEALQPATAARAWALSVVARLPLSSRSHCGHICSHQRFAGRRQSGGIEVGGVGSRDDNYWNVLRHRVGLQLALEVVPAEPWEFQVEQHQIRNMPHFQVPQRVNAVLDGDDGVARSDQCGAIKRPEIGIIFNDQDAAFPRCWGHRACKKIASILKAEGRAGHQLISYEPTREVGFTSPPARR